MGFLVSILLVLILVFSQKIGNNRQIGNTSLLNTFFIYWTAIVFFGSFHFYGLYDISFDVYLLVLEGSFAFALGYSLMRKTKLKKKYLLSKGKEIRFEYVSFRWSFYLLLGFAIIVILKQIMLLLPVILASGMSDARGEMQLDESLMLSGPWVMLIGYFAKPFIKATIIIILVNLFHHKIEKKYIFFVFSLICIYFLSEGGRSAIMEILFSLCYLFYIYRKTIDKKHVKIIKRSIVIFALLPIIATIERGSDILFGFYTYYCGSLQYLSQLLVLDKDIMNDYLYGLASFQGVIKPFTGILNLVGLPKPQIIENASDFILDMQYTVYYTAPNCRMNYFSTIFGYGYKDGGYIGNFIDLLIFGIICKYIDVKEYLKSNTVRWVSIKTIVFTSILFSMKSFPLAAHNRTVAIIFVIIITTKFFSKKHFQNKRSHV